MAGIGPPMAGIAIPASPIPRHDDAVGRLEGALAEQVHRRHQYDAAIGTSLEPNAHLRLFEANERCDAREVA